MSEKKEKKIKWHLLYYLLAALDILTILFSLNLNHQLVRQFKESVRVNKEWNARLDSISQLSNLIEAANAPPNNVFIEKNPQEQERALSLAISSFNDQFLKFLNEINDQVTSLDQTILLQESENLNLQFKKMSSKGLDTLKAYKEGEIDKSLELMALGDQEYGICNRKLENLRLSIRNIIDRHLQEQSLTSDKLSKFEWIILGLVLVTISLVIIYGKKLSKGVLKTEQEQQILIHNMQNYKTAIDQHAIVSKTDLKGIITEVNDKFCEISQYTKEELLGKTHSLVNSGFHSKIFWQQAWKTISSGHVWQGEVKNKTKEGKFYWVRSSIIPFKDLQGNIVEYISIRTDISQNKAQEEELLQAKSIAEEANQAKTQFLANMSHEIRTPLNAILGFSDLLKKTPINEKQQKFLDTILSSGHHLLSLINDILDFSKLQANKIVFESIDFNLEALLLDSFKITQSKAAGKTINLFIDIKKNTPSQCQGDPHRLRQVLINLLNNALKFTERGEIGITACLKDFFPSKQEYLIEIIISDTGIGIPEHKIKTLFTNFQQADQSTTRKYGGTGLGLAISKAIVEGMNGSIRLESQEGIGSQFILNFYLKKPETPNSLTILDTSLLKGISCLIIKDNLTAQRVICEHLKDFECRISSIARNGAEGFSQLEQLCLRHQAPDIVICDLSVPIMNGYEFIKKVHNTPLTSHIKALAVSSDISSSTSEQAVQAGFDGFLSKPYLKKDLAEALQKIVSASKPQQYSVKNQTSLNNPLKKSSRLLIAEDVEANQMLIQAYCDLLGYNVVFANNGKEAIDLLQNLNDFSMCFMDFQMPVMDGVTATKFIRKNLSASFPIIGLTAAILKEEEERMKESGMNEIIFKPVTLDKLKEMIEKYQ